MSIPAQNLQGSLHGDAFCDGPVDNGPSSLLNGEALASLIMEANEVGRGDEIKEKELG